MDIVVDRECQTTGAGASNVLTLTWHKSSKSGTLYNITSALIEQDKSSDIEQQPPFRDRKRSNALPQMLK